MSTNALSELQYSEKAAKRATWESFEFSVPATGVVVVKNASYGDEADEHTHSVNVTDGVPTECSCKSDEFGSSACKHRVAVAMNTAVLEAATASKLLADGGMVAPSPPELEASEGCPHEHPDCEGADADRERPVLCFECWSEWAAYDEDEEIAAANDEDDQERPRRSEPADFGGGESTGVQLL